VASCAGPSAHGSAVSAFAEPSSGIHDHLPPRSASSTVAPASVRSARTEAFGGIATSSASPLPVADAL
jgi:hypothetical protein